MSEVISTGTEYKDITRKVYKYPQRTSRVEEEMEPVSKKTVRKAGDAIVEKERKAILADAFIEEKVNPKVPLSHTKQVEIKIRKEIRGKPCSVSFD